MRKRIIAGILSATAALNGFSIIAAADNADVTVLYVSSDGSDNGTGDKNSPLASIEAAKEYIRILKSKGNLGKDGAICYIKGGEYSVKESIGFGTEDSGTETQPITYCAYPGEKVKFVGGVSVKASEFKNITEPEVLAKITYPGLADKIKYIDLKDYGVENIPNAPLYGSYSYMVTDPLGGPKEETPFEAFMGDAAMTLARYPNGNETMQADEIVQMGVDGYKFSEYSRLSGSGFADDAPEWKNYTCLTIKMNNLERLKYWGGAKYAVMNSLLSYDWARQSIPIKNIDIANKTITTEYPAVFTSVAGRPWNIYNLLEELDVPGEYYIDKDSGRFYAYLSDDAYKKNESIELSILDKPLFDFKDASYINLKNISISNVRSNAVNISDSENIRMFGCEIMNIPTRAVNILNSPYSGLDNCYIHDVDAGVLLLGGDYETLTDSNMYVTNCEFENFSRINGTDRPAINFQGVGHKITHNKIHGSPHQGVWFAGNNNYFAYNEIYDVCTDSADAGAIYGLRNATCFGNQWVYNYVHDIGQNAAAEGALGANGIYFDDGMTGGYVAGNVFENINGAGVFGAGRDLNVTNNIFINCSYAATVFDRRNIVKDSGNGAEMIAKLKSDMPWWQDGPNEVWKNAYPDQLDNLLESMTGEGYQIKNEFTKNVVVNSPEVKDETAPGAKVENNYVTRQDPGFFDYKNRNYTLKKDSKVYKEIPDFKFIAFTRMGKVDDRAQNRAKKAVILAVDSNEALLKGEKKYIDENNLNVVPKIKDSKTYVPIRFISEAFDVSVEWDADTKTASIDGGKIIINTSNGEIEKDGEKVDGNVGAFIENGRTYLPLRMISELMEYKVFWDERGFISISDVEDLFDTSNDNDLIAYLYNTISVHCK